jgi:hypothetical protein
MYHRHGDHYHFDETLYQVGEADTLFSGGAAQPGDEAREEKPPGTISGAADPASAAVDGAVGIMGVGGDAVDDGPVSDAVTAAGDALADAAGAIGDVVGAVGDAAAGVAEAVVSTALDSL